MRISQKLANYTAGEADGFRKPWVRRNQVLAQEYEKFSQGMFSMVTPGRGRCAVGTIEPFASYAFNKSHAAATDWYPSGPRT